MIITNIMGSIVRRVNYQAGGQWINMSRYPSAVYFAETYGTSITFIR
jgi:hypothetical protein